MADRDHPSLREYIERIIDENNRFRDALRLTDNGRIDESIKSVDKALRLQAAEYERRLGDLNHAHEQARQVLGTYLPRELYERGRSESLEWQRKADLQAVAFEARLKSVELGIVNLPGGVKSLELGLATQAGQNIGSRATGSLAITIVAVIVAVGGVVIGLLGYLAK